MLDDLCDPFTLHSRDQGIRTASVQVVGAILSSFREAVLRLHADRLQALLQGMGSSPAANAGTGELCGMAPSASAALQALQERVALLAV